MLTQQVVPTSQVETLAHLLATQDLTEDPVLLVIQERGQQLEVVQAPPVLTLLQFPTLIPQVVPTLQVETLVLHNVSLGIRVQSLPYAIPHRGRQMASVRVSVLHVPILL